jgi:hypothetical protein
VLPYESHGYRAHESVMHVLAEKEAWLDTYCSCGAAAGGAEEAGGGENGAGGAAGQGTSGANGTSAGADKAGAPAPGTVA